MDGDADLIGYMFWSTLHGIVVLDMAGRAGRRDRRGHPAQEDHAHPAGRHGGVAAAPDDES